MVSVSDIEDKVRNRVADIPTDITDAIIEEYINDAIIDVNNITGDTISSSSVDTKYQALLTDMGVISVLRWMVHNSFSLGGEVSINRDSTLRLIKDLEKKVSEKLKDILTRTQTGVDTTEPELNLG